MSLLSFLPFRTIVLPGGFMRGVVLLGTLSKLYELGMIGNVDTYIGTSVGAVIGFLLSLEYTPEEIAQYAMYDIIIELQRTFIRNFVETGKMDHEFILNKISKMIEKKGYDKDITLMDHFQMTKKTVIVSSYAIYSHNYDNKCGTEYISYKTKPNMKCLDAMRTSFSIPMLFQPILSNDVLYIDGGMEANLPYKISEDSVETLLLILTNGDKTSDKGSLNSFYPKGSFGERTELKIRPMIHSFNIYIPIDVLKDVYEITKRRTEIHFLKEKVS
jgi:NTE family protein